MQYKSKAVTGDAGEYFFAYKATSMFKWAVRLLDVDLGVDAEIEVVENGKSDLRLIKVQIKSSVKVTGNSHSIYVTPEHIEYWKNTNLPVLVCLVDLNNEKIYWKHIKNELNYKSSGESSKVTFDLRFDELTERSKSELLKIAIPNEFKHFDKLKTELNQLLSKLPQPVVHQYVPHTDNELDELFNNIDKSLEILKKMRELILIHPNIGNNGINSHISGIHQYLMQCHQFAEMCNRAESGWD
ncbi:DUF4365 domain-containing protein [Vibrio sp. 10N.261.51.F11]|uniref:DUF4365 domain-containing protein n=1 Tax=unclassified Vibrio TaxID=2614977 RepID=UPI003553C4BD